jgi:organic hydroperoxide reductase OsmC/OhrA
MHLHRYKISLEWTGNLGTGTSAYTEYDRTHDLTASGKPSIAGSSDPSFQGDAQRWSPEELLVASLAACHQLWYLHLCADAGIVVTAYRNTPCGEMSVERGGEGQFGSVILRPVVEVAAGSDVALALALHDAAAEKCFIARSVNFPVRHEPQIIEA